MARMAELLGILGTSGFVGMMLGTHLGDLLAGSGPIERWLVDRMFIAAGLSALAAVPFAWLATRKIEPPSPHTQPPAWALIRKYHPGFVLAVGVVTGAALSLPQTFLRTYAEAIHVPRIGVFFTVVAATAVTTRVVNRRVLERLGLTVMIFIGLGLLALAQVLYLVVHCEWQLVFPGLPYGIGQAILYPVIAAVGTTTFPTRYRGLGITLVLAAFDAGQLIAGPLAGGVLHVCGSVGLAGYPTLFLATAAMLVAVGAVYWWTLERQPSADAEEERPVILRFPCPPPERRALVGQAASLPVGCASEGKLPACPTTRPRVGNSRSTVAGRR
jgi:MFS family permease